MLLAFFLAAFSLFCGLCARFAGWFCKGVTSREVGAGSDSRSMAAVYGGLRGGIDIEPTESWLLFIWFKLFVRSVVSVGFWFVTEGSCHRCGGMVMCLRDPSVGYVVCCAIPGPSIGVLRGECLY
jgi:hypothetical protein